MSVFTVRAPAHEMRDSAAMGEENGARLGGEARAEPRASDVLTPRLRLAYARRASSLHPPASVGIPDTVDRGDGKLDRAIVDASDTTTDCEVVRVRGS